MFYPGADSSMDVRSPPVAAGAAALSRGRMDFSPPHPEGYTMTGPGSGHHHHHHHLMGGQSATNNGLMAAMGNGDQAMSGHSTRVGGNNGGGDYGHLSSSTQRLTLKSHLDSQQQHTGKMDSTHHSSTASSRPSTSSSPGLFKSPSSSSATTTTRPPSSSRSDSNSRSPSRSPSSPGLNSSSGSRSVPTSLVDEEFLKHYKVDEIQAAMAGGGPAGGGLVDEHFLRHYQVEEMMGGFNAAASPYGAATAGGGYYASGYEHYMYGQDYPRGPPPGFGPPDFKLEFEELCPVCGDKVSGYHYGMPTCESCKGFFKRTVQNKKVYSCVDNRQCMIDKTQRKRCPYCRFQKCLSVGMKLEAVRSDRMRGGRNKFGPMYKRDRAIKQQALRQRQQMLAQMQCQMQLSGMGMNGGGGPGSMPPGMGPPNFMEGMGPPHHMPGEPLDIKPNLAMLPLPPHGGGSGGQHPGASTPSPSHHPHMGPHGSHMGGGGGGGSSMGGMMSPGAGGMHRPPGMPPLSSQQQQHDMQQQQHSPSIITSSQQQGNNNSFSHSASYTSMMSSSSSASASHNNSHMPPGAHHHPGQHHHPQHHMDPLSLPPLPPPPPMQQQQSQQHVPSSPISAPTTPSIASSLATQQPMMNLSSVSAAVSTSGPPSSPPGAVVVPVVIRELQKNDANPVEVQRKLAQTADMMLQQQTQLTGEQRQKEGLCGSDGSERRADGTSLTKAEVQLLCKLCDQALFLLVEWARSAHYFKELKVEDQMKLLQNCWSELLILDFIFKQMEHHNPDELLLITGHRVPMEMLEKVGLGDCRDRLQDLIKKFRDLKLDRNEYTCLRHLVLLNPDVATLANRGAVEQCQEKVNSTLLEYCTTYYASVRDKFGQLLVRLPEIRLISLRVEDYLYFRHISGDIPESTLLMEMLHSKRK